METPVSLHRKLVQLISEFRLNVHVNRPQNGSHAYVSHVHSIYHKKRNSEKRNKHPHMKLMNLGIQGEGKGQ